MLLTKVISGGQTGADQGALQAARAAGIATGGTAPKGYRTERGSMRELLQGTYGLAESASEDYPPRTEQNVLAADATLILSHDHQSAGTLATLRFCKKHRKDYYITTPELMNAWEIFQFVRDRFKTPGVLNVAGNRESSFPGIQQKTDVLLQCVFHHLQGKQL